MRRFFGKISFNCWTVSFPDTPTKSTGKARLKRVCHVWGGPNTKTAESFIPMPSPKKIRRSPAQDAKRSFVEIGLLSGMDGLKSCNSLASQALKLLNPKRPVAVLYLLFLQEQILIPTRILAHLAWLLLANGWALHPESRLGENFHVWRQCHLELSKIVNQIGSIAPCTFLPDQLQPRGGKSSMLFINLWVSLASEPISMWGSSCWRIWQLLMTAMYVKAPRKSSFFTTVAGSETQPPGAKCQACFDTTKPRVCGGARPMDVSSILSHSTRLGDFVSTCRTHCTKMATCSRFEGQMFGN